MDTKHISTLVNYSSNIKIIEQYFSDINNDEYYQLAVDEINYNIKYELNFLTGDSILICISNLLKDAINNGNILK